MLRSSEASVTRAVGLRAALPATNTTPSGSRRTSAFVLASAQEGTSASATWSCSRRLVADESYPRRAVAWRAGDLSRWAISARSFGGAGGCSAGVTELGRELCGREDREVVA